MKRSSKSLGRQDWIDAATQMLATGGLAAVKVEAVARKIGVTKGSFYWHFANRGALVAAILESWEQRQTLSIIDRVEEKGGDAGQRLEELWRLAGGALDQVDDNLVEMALREESTRDRDVAAFVRRVDEQRMGYLRRLFSDLGHPQLESEARSLLCYSLMVGNAFINSGHQSFDRRQVLRQCRDLLFATPKSQGGD